LVAIGSTEHGATIQAGAARSLRPFAVTGLNRTPDDRASQRVTRCFKSASDHQITP
jgi:hypothetical protein